MRRTRPPTTQEEIEDIMQCADDGTTHLTSEELIWVRLAIKKEAQTILFRRAVIEKTITALIWSAIVGFGYVILEVSIAYLVAHGWKR